MGLVIKIIIKFRGCEPLIRALGAGFVKGLEANDRGIRFRADANLLQKFHAEPAAAVTGCLFQLMNGNRTPPGKYAQEAKIKYRIIFPAL